MDSFLSQIKNIVSKSKTNNIAIIGKGSSVDNIKLDRLNDFIKIGINDAEKIVKCDVSIFHENWVIESLKSNNFNSSLYVTNLNLNNYKVESLKVTYQPSTQDYLEMMFSRLISNDFEQPFIIEETIFISALRLCRIISNILSKQMNVYMLGFDFDHSKGYSIKMLEDFSKSSLYSNQLKTKIYPQEYYYQNAIYILSKSELSLYHVGNHKLSNLSHENFNLLGLSNTSFDINENNLILITAELTTNHFGDLERLEKMIKLAVQAGADLIKIQKRDVESFYSKEQLDSKYISPFGETFRDYRNKLELDFDGFTFIDKLCRSLGVEWFASILDYPSFEFIMQFNPKLIKLPSTISEHTDFLERVSQSYNGNVVISTGMTDSKHEDYLIRLFHKNTKLFLMHTNSSYPTPLEDININVIKHYYELSKLNPNLIPAYSSHDNGWFGSILAVAAGAQMIEKHVKIGNNDWAHFDAVALDLEGTEFRDFVINIRLAKIALGKGIKLINSKENHKYKVKSVEL